ncbi:hypothetical protein [Mucilaginibacter lacusdianchii]|uniref:hypothetical protein n=1 Tax=Mucilaginibacter lacusdianchii TaxID=2684211 RepID=UPI00131EBB1C|nr:hypothetical protein [Mucilaginibacter sp. JXJ CY 39]
MLITLSGLYSCKPDIRETGAALKYFDLKKFIHTDSARLSKQQVWVTKMVSHNQESAQTRKLRITNWGRELDLFAASDINKPAWRESYSIQRQGDSVVYTAKDPKLFTRRLMIQQSGNTVKKITIQNATSNILYQSSEKLVYYPDSLYLIDKLQQVKLLGDNRYLIKGVISK